MSQRESNLLWLKDMIEHLSACHQQLQWTEDPDTIQMLAETMLRDLESCRRICESVRRTRPSQAASSWKKNFSRTPIISSGCCPPGWEQ